MAVPVFPTFPGLSYPVKRTPVWSTIQQQSLSGSTPRYPLWSYPRWKYELTFEVLRQSGAFTELTDMAGFYNALRGSAGVFAFPDPSDGAVTAQNFGTGTGAATAFQLVRSFGGFTEPVFAPSGTPQIFVNGVLKTVTTDYTISATGLVTFTTAPGNALPITWTGTFNWLCQFDDDGIELQQDFSGIWLLSALRFTTFKP